MSRSLMLMTDLFGPIGPPVATVTSLTRPVSPFEGDIIYETDTDRILKYDGNRWLPFAS